MSQTATTVRVPPATQSPGRLCCLCALLAVLMSCAMLAPIANCAEETSTELAESLQHAHELWLKSDAVKGIPVHERLLGEIQESFGKDSPIAGLVLFRIGFLHGTHGDFQKALPYLERSLNLVGPLPDDEQNLVIKADLYWGLGMSYKALLKPDQAVQAFDESLKRKEKLLGVDNPKLVEILIEAATLRYLQQRPAEAIPFMERALAISEKEGKGEGDDESVTTILNGLAQFYDAQGEYRKAASCLERALVANERRFGLEHVNCLANLKGLADVTMKQGNYGRALILYDRYLILQEKVFGPDNVWIPPVLNNIAEIYREQGDYVRALSTYERCIDLRERTLPSDDPEIATILNNLAVTWTELNAFDKAIALSTRSLAIKEKAFGSEHRNLIPTLSTLGFIYRKLGDYERATAIYERSLRLASKHLGEKHPEFAGILALLADLSEVQGHHDQALGLYERSLAIKQHVFGRMHPRVATAINNIAQIYRKQDRLPEAESAQIESLEVLENCIGTDNPSFLNGLSNLGVIYVAHDNLQDALLAFARFFPCLRRYSTGQLSGLPEAGVVRWQQGAFLFTEVFQTLCESPRQRSNNGPLLGAEQLSLTKAFAEEIQAVRAAIDSDSKVVTQHLRNQYADLRAKLARLPETILSRERADLRRRQLATELIEIETKLGEQVRLVAQTLQERTLTLPEIARALPTNAVLLDIVQYRRYNFAVQTNQWRDQRYAAYLTFPLPNGSTNIVVERVGLGEAAPINEALGIIAKRFSAVPAQYRAKDVQPALQTLSDMVYAPLAKHLTNVLHLIICPDGQLGRLPFEILPVGNKYLVEEKTISYVTSGREVARLASSKSKIQTSKSLVMGNPDFDFVLPGNGGHEEALSQKSEVRNPKSEIEVSLLTSAATKTLSRDYRGLKFAPLPDAEAEARSVAKILGDNGVLRLGAEAREAELKAVRSPRVLHLATHGFFLSDQEFNQTNAVGGLAERSPFAIGRTFASLGTIGPRWNAALSQNDWENPMVRCGIALAGANHAKQITNAIAEDGLLTALEASLLNLQGTELVILSACDSGTGELKIGEGVMSLRRAFRIAGAETVLASHWKVSDKATSQLMTEFMRRWRSDQPRAKAWRDAQLSMLQSPDFSSPYFWAAFTLTGQWR